MGGRKSTWRVTVRQLESLIRLSEALAKLECQDEVTEKHVNEARRLLSKSIVRVEQPDIDLDYADENNDANQMDVDETEENGTANQASKGHAHDDDDVSQATQQKKKLTMSYDEYKSLTNMLVLYMRTEESRLEEEGM